jgi:hypothetical protein
MSLPINLPPRIVKGQAATSEWANSVREAIARLASVKPPQRAAGGGGGGSAASLGHFCTIIDVESDKAIKGGVVYCGDKNFDVNHYTLALGTPGTWLVQVILDGIEANTDDDDELILSGIETSTGTPAWDLKTWTDPTDYDSNTNFATPTSDGEIVVPIGKLVIADSVATLTPVGCGNIRITQCAGILTHSRI